MSEAVRPTSRITLDLKLPDVQTSISVTQGDSMRRLEVSLQDGGRAFLLPKKWTAMLVGIKPDDTVLFNSCIVDHGKIIYDFAGGEEIATAVGNFAVRFEIYDETGEEVASPSLWVSVKPNRIRDTASQDQFTAAREIIRRINVAEDDIDHLEEEAERIEKKIDDGLAAEKKENERIEKKYDPLLDLVSTIGEITIKDSSWSRAYPAEAKIRLPDIGENTIVFLVPANDITRVEATNAALAVMLDTLDTETENDSIFVVVRSEHKPSQDLKFTCVAVRGDGELEKSYRPSVSFVGIGSGGNLGLVIKNGMICQKYKIP